jgi:hypothetical protein
MSFPSFDLNLLRNTSGFGMPLNEGKNMKEGI